MKRYIPLVCLIALLGCKTITAGLGGDNRVAYEPRQPYFEITAVSAEGRPTEGVSGVSHADSVEFQHSIDGDGDRLLLVFVAAEGDNKPVWAVTAGGTAMKAVSGASDNIEIGHTNAYYLLEADLPASGDVTISVSAPNVNIAHGTNVHGTAVTVHNALQTEAPTVVSSNVIDNVGEVSVVTNTVENLSLLIDQIYNGDVDDDFTSLVPLESEQTLHGGTRAASSATRGSWRYVSHAGAYTNGWELTVPGNRLLLTVVNVKAAPGAEQPPPPEANQGVNGG